MPPPPESPQAGKARLMQQQRKLERSSTYDGMLGAGVNDVVQRRRKKHFDKCAKASTQIQRIARGWLVRHRLNPDRNTKKTVHKLKKSNKGKQQKETKKERDLSLSPDKLISISPLHGPTLTPLQNAMRLSLRRLGASERELANQLSASQNDLLSNSFVRRSIDPELLVYQNNNKDEDDEDLEQNLCSMFKSNIANVTARARRRSIRGEMSDSFASLEGLL